MALTDKEQTHQHYLAWKGLQDRLISDFDKVLRYEAEVSIETEGRVYYIVSRLDKIKEEITFVTEQLTVFREKLLSFSKQKEEEENTECKN